MRRQQITKRNIASQEKEGNKGNTNSKQRNNTGNRNVSGIKGSGLDIGNEEAWQYSSDKILKTCEDLKSVCMEIDNLEKEKRKLVYMILKDVPRKRRMRK